MPKYTPPRRVKSRNFQALFEANNEEYGYRRIHAALVRGGETVDDETVRSCVLWDKGYAQVRFVRVDGKWQMNGFEEDADTSREEPCPAEPR